MGENCYNEYLFKPCDPYEITRMSKVVFVEGHLDRLDDLLLTILPLVNLVYYKSIRCLDDREYAKEDLISDAIVSLYHDMSLRWDKYIHIESYYSYYSQILKNTMIELVHKYHNYYSYEEADLESERFDEASQDDYEDVEFDILKESINHSIHDTSVRILKCRKVNTNLLLNIFNCTYVEKEGLDNLRSRVRVLGISNNLFTFYCDHVNYVYRLANNYQYAVLGGNQKMMSRISNTIDRFEDITYSMLSMEYYDSIIPEIYAEFGADVAKKFVKTFSGRTVQVPKYRDFCDNLLGGVVMTLSEGDKSNLYRVAEEYNIPYRTLSRIYNKATKYNTSQEG